jgi:hypothetical protein
MDERMGTCAVVFNNLGFASGPGREAEDLSPASSTVVLDMFKAPHTNPCLSTSIMTEAFVWIRWKVRESRMRRGGEGWVRF